MLMDDFKARIGIKKLEFFLLIKGEITALSEKNQLKLGLFRLIKGEITALSEKNQLVKFLKKVEERNEPDV